MERKIEEGTFKKGEWTSETITIYDENGSPTEVESYYFKNIYQTNLASQGSDGTTTNGLTITDIEYIYNSYQSGSLPTTTNENGEIVIKRSDVWTPNTEYFIDDVVYYDGVYFVCLQDHTSEAEWPPTLTPNLWKNQNEK